MAQDFDLLLARVERLERRNRLLSLALLMVPVLAVAGWQTAPEVLRVRRLEIVDARGVPLVALHADRNAQGGAITLRDSKGERRGWWQVSPEGGSLTMSSESGGENDNTAGIAVSPKSSRVTLISPKGASANVSMEGDAPRVDLWNSTGASLFGAPWKK